MSTGTARAVVAAALLGGACAGAGPGPVSDQVLAPVQKTVGFRPGHTGSVPFVLTSAGVPVAGQKVLFALINAAAGVTLAQNDALTDVNGIAIASVHASVETMFSVRATAGTAVAEALVVVGTLGNVVVAPFFAPSASSAPLVTTIELGLLAGTSCRDIAPAHPPTPLPGWGTSLSARGGPWEFDNVPTDETSAADARALDRQGAPVAAGCVDLPGSTLLPDGTVQVALPLYDTVPDPVGRFSAISWLGFSPPLAAAGAIAAPWRDLTDCPLDPAQLWLDCAIDALSPATADDPLDCVPSEVPGGEGPIGDALIARRGTPITGASGMPTVCRGPRDAGLAVSLDAVLLGLYGSPLPQPVVMLPAIADDAAHLLDRVTLNSTLDVAAGDRPDRFFVTHTLTAATLAGSLTETTIALLPLGLPVLSAQATATTKNGQLFIAGHGFTLRLGTVTKAAFGITALAPRGLPANPAAVPAALAELAGLDDGSARGCDAMDQTLCPLAGFASGCLLAACNDGTQALGALLDASFDPADGSGLDLGLAGSAVLLDSTGSGFTHQLGSSGDDKSKVAAWSVDLLTRLGRSRFDAPFTAARN